MYVSKESIFNLAKTTENETGFIGLYWRRRRKCTAIPGRKNFQQTTASGVSLGHLFCQYLLGSLLIGILMGVALKNSSLSENQTLLLVTGFCGGFTTFSAFAYENQVFLKEGDFTSFFIYTLGFHWTWIIGGIFRVLSFKKFLMIFKPFHTCSHF